MRSMSLMLIMLFILAGCGFQPALNMDTDKTDMSINERNSTPGEMTQQTQRKTLQISDELRKYAAAYCNQDIPDFEISTKKAVTNDQQPASSTQPATQVNEFTKSSTVSQSTKEINSDLISSILNKLPTSNLDSSITFGITVNKKDYFGYVQKGQPVVSETRFDFDSTKVVLAASENSILELSDQSPSTICSKFKSLVGNEIDYELHFGWSESLKTGVSELKKCLV